MKDYIIGFLIIITYIIISILVVELYKQKNLIQKQEIKIIEYKYQNKQLKNKINIFTKKYLYVNVTLTAYTSSIDETNEDNMNTAIMEKPYPGRTVAVSQDLSYLLGKTIYIEGIGIRRVNDLMNKRYTKTVDVLVPTKEMAYNFGVKTNINIVVIGD
ncbi:MAG: hypothetical protein ACOC1K_01205 [Nanoarchaeota archaeon]